MKVAHSDMNFEKPQALEDVSSIEDKNSTKIITVIDPEKLGREFFASELDKSYATSFLETLLSDRTFVSLYKALQFGYVKPQHSPRHYVTNSLGLHDLDSGYFHLFLDLAAFTGLDEKTILKVAVASFVGEMALAPWQRAAKGYIIRKAEKDFNLVAKQIISLDPTFSVFAILLELDSKKAATILIDKLLFGVNVNKSDIRRLLIANKIDINHLYGQSYFGCDLKLREAVVRLALLYKTEPDSERFLKTVLIHDSSAHIKRIITAHNDRSRLASVSSSSSSIENSNKRTTKTLQEELTDRLLDGATVPVADFLRRLKTDKDYCSLASKLFFSVYERRPAVQAIVTIEGSEHFSKSQPPSVLSDIIIVDNGNVLDLDNNPIELKGNCTVGLLHPIEIPTKYSFLKNLNIGEQPILQIKRNSYFSTDLERMSSEIKRVSGTVVNAENFKDCLKNNNFKLVYGRERGLYEYAAYFIGDFSIVLEFTPTNFENLEGTTLTLKTAKIYKGSDFVPVRGNLYIQGARPVRIETVPARTLSECIYALLKVGNLII